MKKIRASVLGLVVSLGMFPTPVTRAPFTITVTGVVRSTTCPTEEQCFDVNWTAKPPIEVTITGWTVTLNLTDAAGKVATGNAPAIGSARTAHVAVFSNATFVSYSATVTAKFTTTGTTAGTLAGRF